MRSGAIWEFSSRWTRLGTEFDLLFRERWAGACLIHAAEHLFIQLRKEGTLSRNIKSLSRGLGANSSPR